MAEVANLRRVAFITSDVHHPDFKRIYYRKMTADPDYELKASLEYAKILKELDVPYTLFITGKTLDMFPDIIKNLRNAEIGAHTYYAFRGLLYGYTMSGPLYAKMFGTPYGPKLLIRHDVFKVAQVSGS